MTKLHRCYLLIETADPEPSLPARREDPTYYRGLPARRGPASDKPFVRSPDAEMMHDLRQFSRRLELQGDLMPHERSRMIQDRARRHLQGEPVEPIKPLSQQRGVEFLAQLAQHGPSVRTPEALRRALSGPKQGPKELPPPKP